MAIVNNVKKIKITFILVFATVFIFVLFTYLLPRDYSLFFIQINEKILIKFEIWRLVSSVFFHANVLYLFSNIIGLFLFGFIIENNQYISTFKYLIIYLISGIVANIFSLFLLPLDMKSQGSSGAIFGLIGIIFVNMSIKNKSSFILTILYILFFLLSSLSPDINIWSHLFGLLTGIIIGIIIYFSNNNHKKSFNINLF